MTGANHELAFSGLWTWDHSTNWCGDPTKAESGCFNLYRKEPASFLEDYTALLEFCGRKGIPRLMIAGLFRDSHGGERAAHELLAIARANGVKVLAGIGVNSYGGFYWEGDHPWSLETWLAQHPELRAVVSDPPIGPRPGLHGLGMACPMKEETVRWYEDGTRWLLENFDVAGIYLETGDYGLCRCETCLARSKEREQERAEQAREQFINEAIAGRVSHDDIALAMPPVVNTAFSVRPDADIVYATYSGFSEDTLRNPPPFIATIDPRAVCQWTLTDMPYPEPWGPAGLRPPAARNIGYSHLASQWGEVNTRQPAGSAVRPLALQARRRGRSGGRLHSRGAVAGRELHGADELRGARLLPSEAVRIAARVRGRGIGGALRWRRGGRSGGGLHDGAGGGTRASGACRHVHGLRAEDDRACA